MLSASQCVTVAFYLRDSGEFYCHACVEDHIGEHSLARLQEGLTSGWSDAYEPFSRYAMDEYDGEEASQYAEYLRQDFEYVDYDYDGSEWVFYAADEISEDEDHRSGLPEHSRVETFCHCGGCGAEFPNYSHPEPVKREPPTGPIASMVVAFVPEVIERTSWLDTLSDIQAWPIGGV